MVLPRACGRPLPPASFLLLLALLAACGAGDAAEKRSGGSPLCDDIEIFAASNVSDAHRCPPATCWVDHGGYHCDPGLAVFRSDEGVACTQFQALSDVCTSLCAPPTCYFIEGGVFCDPGCSESGQTCYKIELDGHAYQAACSEG